MRMVKGKIKLFSALMSLITFFYCLLELFFCALTSRRTVNMTSAKESRKFMNLWVVNVKRAESEDKLVEFFALIVTKRVVQEFINR